MQPPSEANGPRRISDEDIQRFRLDKVTPHNAPITLADYDLDWPAHFAREAARIRATLGGRAVQVEHVGSTSVPGLAAKPIVDILLAVPDSADEQAYVPALEAVGYVLRARDAPDDAGIGAHPPAYPTCRRTEKWTTPTPSRRFAARAPRAGAAAANPAEPGSGRAARQDGWRGRARPGCVTG